MRRLTAVVALCAMLAAPALHAADTVRFSTVDVYVDSPAPFAAWQFRFSDRNSVTTIVGVENGDSDAFSDAPWFDRDAVTAGDADRLIVADYSLVDESRLPEGRVRVATLHVMLDTAREPDYELELVTVTTADGASLDASIGFETDTGSRQ